MKINSIALSCIYDGALIVSPSGLIQQANAQAATLLAHPQDAFANTSITQHFTDMTPLQWQSIATEATTRPFTLLQRTGEGLCDHPLSFQLMISALPDQHLFCVLFRPSSDRTENDRARVDMEIKFLTLFEHSTDGLALFEKSEHPAEPPRLIMCNDSYVKMTGRSMEELMEADLTQFIKEVHTQSTEEGGKDEEFERVFSWIRPDQAENFIASRTVDIDLGSRHYVYSINHDISDRKKAEQQSAMLASLGAACHHLGQPAQILMANLSLLKLEHQGDPELIETCEQAVDRIAEILYKLNTVTEFKTIPYAQGNSLSGGDWILDI